MAELEQNSACSEETSSICDEGIRKLFQACDVDGEEFIDRLVFFCRPQYLRLSPGWTEEFFSGGTFSFLHGSLWLYIGQKITHRPEIRKYGSYIHDHLNFIF